MPEEGPDPEFGPRPDVQECLGPVGDQELKKVIGRLSPDSAPDTDDAPASFLKMLGRLQRQALKDALSTNLESGEMPAGWKRGRMLFLYKGSGDRSSYVAYRPITVSPVPYRLFA
ncbi:hypothetical protein V5799_020236 [Amblyomma americanum]|uniref:Uncharacterized protein n=1 Tax=Amblyomma americanum TaxID=6943 RepID=A0AAQ4EUD2_AMBAM